MWAEQVLLGVIGFASGAVIAGGLLCGPDPHGKTDSTV